MTSRLQLSDGSWVVRNMVSAITAQREYLSEIDGAIGDGDHGINMSKGFALCGRRLDGISDEVSFPKALEVLAYVLLDEMGGSMGPLYGALFLAVSTAISGHESLDKDLFLVAISDGTEAVQAIGNAQLGDKTLLDTLIPAREGYRAALVDGYSFDFCLKQMVLAAERGMLSTRDLRARVGRSARLGDRSIGVLDPGACSCFLILQSLADSLTIMLGQSKGDSAMLEPDHNR